MQENLSLLPQHHSEKRPVDTANLTVDPELEIGDIEVPALTVVALTRFEVDILNKLLEKQPCGEYASVYGKIKKLHSPY